MVSIHVTYFPFTTLLVSSGLYRIKSSFNSRLAPEMWNSLTQAMCRKKKKRSKAELIGRAVNPATSNVFLRSTTDWRLSWELRNDPQIGNWCNLGISIGGKAFQCRHSTPVFCPVSMVAFKHLESGMGLSQNKGCGSCATLHTWTWERIITQGKVVGWFIHLMNCLPEAGYGPSTAALCTQR